MLMIIGFMFCTSDFTQLVCGMSAYLSALGEIVFSVCVVVYVVCQVESMCQVESLVLYLQFCSTLNKKKNSSLFFLFFTYIHKFVRNWVDLSPF